MPLKALMPTSHQTSSPPLHAQSRDSPQIGSIFVCRPFKDLSGRSASIDEGNATGRESEDLERPNRVSGRRKERTLIAEEAKKTDDRYNKLKRKTIEANGGPRRRRRIWREEREKRERKTADGE